MALTKSHTSTSSAVHASERRRYPRFPFISSIRVSELNEEAAHAPAKSKRAHSAKIKNLGQGGAKITSLQPLTPHAKVLIHMNLKPLSVVIDTRDLLFVSTPKEGSHETNERSSEDGKQILAEVVWRHLNLETGLFEAGLRFVEEWRRRDYEPYLTPTFQTAS